MNIDGGLRALNDARQLHVAAAGEADRERAHSSVSKFKGSHTWARAAPGVDSLDRESTPADGSRRAGPGVALSNRECHARDGSVTGLGRVQRGAGEC